MRQLLSLLLALLAVTTMQANELRHVGGVPYDEWWHDGHAIDKDFKALPCFYNDDNDSEARFIILGEDLSILKEFTIKNLMAHYPVYLYGEHDLNLYEYGPDCCATQTFFNDDEKWEVIMAEEDGKYGVYNEDGERICAAPTYRDLWDDDGEYIMRYLRIKDAVYFYDSDRQQFYTYNQNVGNTVAELPAAAAKAYPNPLRHGETLTIEMENGLDGTYKVEVVDMKGAKLFSAEKEAKNGVIKVPSVRLQKGWNVYTVKDGDEIIEKGKILVK